jgi:hypothetical protein
MHEHDNGRMAIRVTLCIASGEKKTSPYYTNFCMFMNQAKSEVGETFKLDCKQLKKL